MERQVASFVSAVKILVGLRDFDGALPTLWQLTLIRAGETPDQRLFARVLLLRDDYVKRFGECSRWVREIQVRRIVQAGEREPGDDRPSTSSVDLPEKP